VKLDGASEARESSSNHPAADGSCPGDAGNLRLPLALERLPVALIVAQSGDMMTLTVGLSTLQSLVPSTNSLMAAAISFFPSLVTSSSSSGSSSRASP